MHAFWFLASSLEILGRYYYIQVGLLCVILICWDDCKSKMQKRSQINLIIRRDIAKTIMRQNYDILLAFFPQKYNSMHTIVKYQALLKTRIKKNVHYTYLFYSFKQYE